MAAIGGTIANGHATQPDPAVEPPGWIDTIFIVIGATIVAWGAAAVVILPLAGLDLIPVTTGEDLPGTGWPWRVDGIWSVAADLGPLLAAAFLLAAAIAFFLRRKTGVAPRRWPLALLATALGWLPIAGDRPGLVGVGGGFAFVVMVVATRAVAVHPRREPSLSRARAAGVAGGLIVVGAVVSFSYGALHPVLARSSVSPQTEARKGDTQINFSLESQGPLDARVLSIRPATSGLPVTELRTDGPTEAPTYDGLFKPLGQPTLHAGQDDLPVYMTVARPPCPDGADGPSTEVRAVDVRFRVAGTERTQRLDLARVPRVPCRG